MKKSFDYSGLLIPFVFAALVAYQLLMARPATTSIPYSDFHRLVDARLVDDLDIGQSSISGVLRMPEAAANLPASDAAAVKKAGPPWRFTTNRVADDRLVTELTAAGIRYRGVPDSGWLETLAGWMLPVILLVTFWSFMMRRPGGVRDFSGMGKSQARVYVQQETGITFDDIAGIDEAKAELQQIVAFLRNPERYQRLGGKIPKGVLIVGAPGTGKTLLARAVAGEAAVPFFTISGSAFVEMFVGVGAARVRDLFEQAQQKAPCIVFIDELDALGKARGVGLMSGNDEREQTLNQLLVEMDGFQANSGVIIMAATNRPEILDPALLRPGRFDRHIAIDRPDLNGRKQILAVHTKRVKLAPEVDLAELAQRTPGFVGADLANVVNEAALHAAELGKPAIGMADFDEAIDRAMTGMERKSRVMNDEEKRTIAYHEAGHALVAQSRVHCDPVKKVSIIPRGIAALGYTQQVPTEDRYVLRKSELLDRLDVLLGGRVAEEIAFGDVSTGAQNDLERATALARHMVMQYGMSAKLGLATLDDATPQGGSPGVWTPGDGRCSEHTAQLIDEEVRALLEDAHVRVAATLGEHRDALERIARCLLQHESIDHDTLVALITPPDDRDAAPGPARADAEPVAATDTSALTRDWRAGRSTADADRAVARLRGVVGNDRREPRIGAEHRDALEPVAPRREEQRVDLRQRTLAVQRHGFRDAGVNAGLERREHRDVIERCDLGRGSEIVRQPDAVAMKRAKQPVSMVLYPERAHLPVCRADHPALRPADGRLDAVRAVVAERETHAAGRRERQQMAVAQPVPVDRVMHLQRQPHPVGGAGQVSGRIVGGKRAALGGQRGRCGKRVLAHRQRDAARTCARLDAVVA
ncbi:Cell division protein FtsH [Burkholderia cepacia]|nr:Cell division protein FtsH [Burkholderia cepacia]